MSVEVRLARADDESAIVRNLMSLYLFEHSGATERQVEADGVYRYSSLDAFWTEPGCYPFLIRTNGDLAGFALVAERRLFEDRQDGHLIAEFFILPTHRRRGIGQAAAGLIFSQFPGDWWIPQPHWNEVAQAFWRTVVKRYSAGKFREDPWIWEEESGVAQFFTVPGTSDD
jgi:predicted acetyltransferase